jgi:hypothetical protein
LFAASPSCGKPTGYQESIGENLFQGGHLRMFLSGGPSRIGYRSSRQRRQRLSLEISALFVLLESFRSLVNFPMAV